MVPLWTLTNQSVAPRGGSRSEGSPVGPFGVRLGPVEKLTVRGTNLIIFINRRSSTGAGERQAGREARAEVKVGAAREKRGKVGREEVRPWKVAVVAESSIRVIGSSARERERRNGV